MKVSGCENTVNIWQCGKINNAACKLTDSSVYIQAIMLMLNVQTAIVKKFWTKSLIIFDNVLTKKAKDDLAVDHPINIKGKCKNL